MTFDPSGDFVFPFYCFFFYLEERSYAAALFILTDSVKEHQMRGRIKTEKHRLAVKAIRRTHQQGRSL